MATPTQIPTTSLAKLKCSWCNGYLSVPPINMLKDDAFTCGRCNPSGKRIAIYEELLKFIKFPCVFANCNSVLAWGQVKNHEDNCVHKTIVCPHYSCKQQFEVRLIEKHFRQSHLVFVQSNPTIVTQEIGNDVLYRSFKADKKLILMMYNKKAYLVFVLGNCTPDKNCKDLISSYDYKFGVYSMDNQKNNKVKYTVSLRIISAGSNYGYVRDNRVQPFNKNLHCFKCLLGNCPLKYHKKMNNWLQIEFQNIQKSPDLKIEYEIHISELEPKVTQEVPPVPSEMPGSSDMAKKLECPICQEYMCAPIYNCITGHSICAGCKELLSACPFCKASISNSRNYILEDIAETLKISCTNSKKGCPFVGFVKNVKIHERACLFNK